MNHALHVSKLPQHHRDPFDRLLIAQAQLEGLPVLSSDHQLANYQVEVIW
jgi:PIN domain nuclease of toxin-antitoxin system